MRDLFKHGLRALLIMVVLLLLFRLVQMEQHYAQHQHDDLPFPTQHIIHTLDAVPQSLGHYLPSEHSADHVVLISAWATWCQPCLREIPTLNRLHAYMQEHGIGKVLGIAFQSGEPHVVKEKIQRYDIDYPVVIGTKELAQAIQLNSFPTAYIINQQGIIKRQLVGLYSYRGLKRMIGDVLSKQHLQEKH